MVQRDPISYPDQLIILGRVSGRLYILCTKNWDNKAIEQPRSVEDNLPEVLEVDPVVGGQVLAKHREVSVQASNHLSERQCARLIKAVNKAFSVKHSNNSSIVVAVKKVVPM